VTEAWFIAGLIIAVIGLARAFERVMEK